MKIVNKEDLAVGDMKDKFLERQALPMGLTQIKEWIARIIPNAGVEADDRSLAFALCGLLMQTGPTEAFREDAYFILALRNAAIKQTAFMYMEMLKKEQKEEQEKLEKETAEDTAPTLRAVEDGVLENQTL